jgi:hypothetical protein
MIISVNMKILRNGSHGQGRSDYEERGDKKTHAYSESEAESERRAYRIFVIDFYVTQGSRAR